MLTLARFTITTTAILMALGGCGPAATSSATNSADAQLVVDKSLPITVDQIAQDLVGKGVQISDAAGDGPSDTWTFEADEYRHLVIVENQRSGNALTIVISMTTRNNPQNDEASIQVSGKLRLRYKQEGAKWVLVGIENLTFKYSIGVGV